MRNFCVFLFSLLLINTTAFSQAFVKYTSPIVIKNGQPLRNAWAGGFNSAMFQAIDMNNDGKKDLFAFEKQSESTYPGVFKIRTFINYGSAGDIDYRYDPFYEKLFPQNMTNFCLLVDYDGDGREDIFTYNRSVSGFDVYHNDSNTTGILTFSLQYQGLQTCYLNAGGNCFTTSLYVAPVNQPVLFDINNDGDLDVLTFQISANFIEYHENMAKELFNRTDTLVLSEVNSKWGHMSLSSNANSAILGLPRIPLTSGNADVLSNRHSGTCMIAFDDDGDGDADLLNGDLLGDNLLYLHNGASNNASDSIDWQDTSFPSNGGPVNYVTFPSAYLLDADNDGITDMIVSSCTESQSENLNNNWYYHNAGSNTSPDFQYVKNKFLTDEMIDVGTASMPVFFDVDADGKTDIVIGNKGYFITQSGPAHYEAALSWYKNTSTGQCPEFTLVSNNFGSFQQYNYKNIYPAFGDLDGDGDADLLLGNEDGTFHYYTNTAGAGNIPQYTLTTGGFNFQNLDVGSNSTPQLYDINNDGLLDLISGELFGKISYFQNTGTVSTPIFSLITTTFGNINVTNTAQTFYGYSVPHLFSDNGTLKLLVGSESGDLFLYDSINTTAGSTFHLISNNTYLIHEPPRAAPAMADLNNDSSPEIIVGNQAGGLSFYSNSLPGCPLAINNVLSDYQVNVYPNPANSHLIIDTDDANGLKKQITLTDLSGRIIHSQNTFSRSTLLNTEKFANGIYLITIAAQSNNITKKIIIRHD